MNGNVTMYNPGCTQLAGSSWYGSKRLQDGVTTETDCPLFPPLKALDAGQVGLALSYAITLTGMFQWSVRQSAEVENMVMFI